MTISLTPGAMSLAALETLTRGAAPFQLDRAAKPAIDRSAEQIAKAAAGDAPVYGVNTGFGKLASVRIGHGDIAQLQRNLILSHSALVARGHASCHGAETFIARARRLRRKVGGDRTNRKIYRR